MANPYKIRDRLINQVGGESLEGSGFESETTDPLYSDDHPVHITEKEDDEDVL